MRSALELSRRLGNTTSTGAETWWRTALIVFPRSDPWPYRGGRALPLRSRSGFSLRTVWTIALVGVSPCCMVSSAEIPRLAASVCTWHGVWLNGKNFFGGRKAEQLAGDAFFDVQQVRRGTVQTGHVHGVLFAAQSRAE